MRPSWTGSPKSCWRCSAGDSWLGGPGRAGPGRAALCGWAGLGRALWVGRAGPGGKAKQTRPRFGLPWAMHASLGSKRGHHGRFILAARVKPRACQLTLLLVYELLGDEVMSECGPRHGGPTKARWIGAQPHTTQHAPHMTTK
jgi:hypothetical protein